MSQIAKEYFHSSNYLETLNTNDYLKFWTSQTMETISGSFLKVATKHKEMIIFPSYFPR